MLTFDLVQTDKHSTNRFATTEKSPIFQSHKSYKKSLPNMADFQSEINNLVLKYHKVVRIFSFRILELKRKKIEN